MLDHVFGAIWYAVHTKRAMCVRNFHRNFHKEVIPVLRKTYSNVT